MKVKENIHRAVFDHTWTYNEINYFDLVPSAGTETLEAAGALPVWLLACLRACMQATRPSTPLEHKHPPLPIFLLA